MWKDFFFFSKGERNGIIILISLIVIVIAINRSIPLWTKNEDADISAFKTEIEMFKTSIASGGAPDDHSLAIKQDTVYQFYFDPNVTDSIRFVQLGIPPSIASRILKYRAKGGKFRKPEDFAKIYGLDESLYTELLPYIRIGEFEKYPLRRVTEKINLNRADADALKSLKGIGNVYAGRIIKYRDYLGGFHSLEQLKEVYGISEELFLSLEPYLSVESSAVKRIRLNHEEDLNLQLKHPYLKEEQISALLSFKLENQTIDSLESLRVLSEFSDADWSRLSPYLSLE